MSLLSAHPCINSPPQEAQKENEPLFGMPVARGLDQCTRESIQTFVPVPTITPDAQIERDASREDV